MSNSIYNNIKDYNKKKISFQSTILTVCKCMLVALIASLIITNYIFQAVTVDGDSMLPTLHSKDRLILDKITYDFSKPKVNDIVVIIPPNDPGKKYIKRIVALGGDTVQIKNHKLYVNGLEKKEWYLNEIMNCPLDENFKNCLTVPKGSVCVLGDNRNHSEDSRAENMGFISLKKVLGKATLRIYPFNNCGFLK